MKANSLLDKPEFDFIRRVSEEYKVKVRVIPLDEGMRGYKIGDEIVLNEGLYPERRNWTFCHELGHIILGHSSEPTPDDDLEADRFAAELMLPEVDFIPDSRGMNLEKLKKSYPHASWEAIARRCIRFHPAILTIFDGEKITVRLGSPELNFPLTPTKEEIAVSEECCRRKEHFSEDFNTLSVNAYYIDEGMGVVRVILISQPDFICD